MNETSLLLLLSFYFFEMSFCIGAVVHGGVSSKRNAMHRGLVITLSSTYPTTFGKILQLIGNLL